MKFLQYGIDAPYAVTHLILAGLALMGVGWAMQFVYPVAMTKIGLMITFFIVGAGWSLLYTAALMVFSSCFSKRHLAKKIIAKLQLQGNESILDIGCGSGLFMIEAAKKLSTGKAIGLDCWVKKDQLKNSPYHTLRNIDRENVYDKTALVTGDMRYLPFKDHYFDVIISNLALHNLSSSQARTKVIEEAVRIVKPGGRILFIDFQYTKEYSTELSKILMKNVHRSKLNFIVCPPVRLVSAEVQSPKI